MLSPTLSSAQTELDHSVQDVELADVVRQFGSEYTSRYQKAMLPSQTKALADIAACCTKQLGGNWIRPYIVPKQIGHPDPRRSRFVQCGDRQHG